MAKTTADLLAMKTELDGDPSGAGYTGDDALDAALINSADTSAPVERFDIPVHEIAQAINYAEFTALSAASRQYLDLVLRGDSIDARTATEARAGFLAAFGAGSATRANLSALFTKEGTRAEVLWQAGVLSTGEAWTPSDVANARRAT